MLNPKKGVFSEMIQIPVNEIEAANRLIFRLNFPPKEKSEEVKKENGKAEGNELPTVPRKRAKHSVTNSEMEKNQPKRNRTKLFGTCMAIMELGKFPWAY